MKSETKEKLQKMGLAAMKGASKGGMAGVVVAIGTGIAVVATAPAWLPFVGGMAVISTATVATCAAVGAGAGAVVGGTREHFKNKKIEETFDKEFKK